MGSSTQEWGNKLGACMDEAEKARKWKRACSLRADGAERRHANGRGHALCVQMEPKESTQEDESASAACIPSENE